MEKNTNKINIEDTGIFNKFSSFISSKNYMELSELTSTTIFKLAITSMVNFLRFAKHNNKHTVIKCVDDDGDFLLAIETLLDEDEDGNKSWVAGMLLEEDKIEVSEDTKVYTTLDPIYLTSFKNSLEPAFSNIKNIGNEELKLLSNGPIKFIVEFGKDYFEGVKNEDIDLIIEEVCTINFKRDGDKIIKSGALSKEQKQFIKLDGKTDELEEKNEEE